MTRTPPNNNTHTYSPSLGDISHIRGDPSDQALEVFEDKDLEGLYDLEEAPYQEDLGLDVIHGRELRPEGRGRREGGTKPDKPNKPRPRRPRKRPRRKRRGRGRKVRYKIM